MACAAILREFGHPVMVETIDLDPPERGEVLVAMRLAPINPADHLVISGNYGLPTMLHAVIGAEGVGEVIACGDGVQDLAVGDRVIPLTRGNWVSHRKISVDDLIRCPGVLPLEQAAMLRVNPATAWRLLHAAPLGQGDWVIQNGGTSAVAGLVTALARQRGIGVINVTRSKTDTQTTLIDGPDLAGRAAELTCGAPVKLALDCVAGNATGRLAECLGEGGRLVVFGHLSGEPCRISSRLLTARGITLSGFSLRTAEAHDSRPVLQALYKNLATFLCLPGMALPIAAKIPLSRLNEALTLSASASRPNGRVLIMLDH